MATRRYSKMGRVRLALLLAGGLSTALTTLAPTPAGAVTGMTGRGEEHHEWFATPPTNQNLGGGDQFTGPPPSSPTAPCIQYVISDTWYPARAAAKPTGAAAYRPQEGDPGSSHTRRAS